MDKIVRGVASFHRDSFRVLPLMERLADGQKPRALFITCVDSRLDTGMLTRTDPGELFVLRNVGAIVPKSEADDHSVGAAVEFALGALNVPHIVVMGHAACGAMKACCERATPGGNLQPWLHNAEEAVRRMESGEVLDPELRKEDNLAQLNVLQALENLATYDVVRERLDKMSVTLHGWFFDIRSASVSAYDPRHNQFLPVEKVYAEDVDSVRVY